MAEVMAPSDVYKRQLIMNILVETSARHVHVTEADLETLFGKGYQLLSLIHI